jgi:hypothetical protein
MRVAGTWLIVSALGLIGLLAIVDALRAGAGSGAETHQTSSVSPAPVGEGEGRPPPIPERATVREELESAGVRGTLVFTDPECRLWALELPALTWRSGRSAPAPDCRFTLSPEGVPLVGKGVWSPRAQLGAVDESRRTFIELLAPKTGWTHRFEGSNPAFRPDGTLTFVRDGALWEWSDRCPERARTVVFRTGYLAGQTFARCERVLLSKADLGRRLRQALPPRARPPSAYFLDEAVWLDRRSLAVLVSDRSRGTVLAILTEAGVSGLFAMSEMIVRDLQASPRGTYLTARFLGDVVVFDRRLRIRRTSVEAPRAIAWPPSERFLVLAGSAGVSIVQPPDSPAHVVRIPVVASYVAWQEG